jgi:hypothetical protein
MSGGGACWSADRKCQAEAGTEQQAEMRVQQMIDRALAVQETLLSLARYNSEQ